MAKNIDALSKQLQELSKTINSFKSEAVQLKIVDTLLSGLSISNDNTTPVKTAAPVKEVKKVVETKPKIQAKPKAKAQTKPEVKTDKKAEVKVSKPIVVKVNAVKAAKPVQKSKVSKVTKAVKTATPAKAVKAKPAAKVVKILNKSKKVTKVRKENGPTSTINLLFETGYFSTKRNMGEVVKHINNDLKLPYQITALSGLVNKLVKNKKLVRAINPQTKKMEYVKA